MERGALEELVKTTPLEHFHRCIWRFSYEIAKKENLDQQHYIDHGCYMCSGYAGDTTVTGYCDTYKSLEQAWDEKIGFTKNQTR